MAKLTDDEIYQAEWTIRRLLDAISEGTETATPGQIARLEAARQVLRDLAPGPVVLTLDVDGERFAIRDAKTGGTHYDWLTGPNQGYGYSSSASPRRSVEEHRGSIRKFLSAIDPRTGYIEDA